MSNNPTEQDNTAMELEQETLATFWELYDKIVKPKTEDNTAIELRENIEAGMYQLLNAREDTGKKVERELVVEVLDTAMQLIQQHTDAALKKAMEKFSLKKGVKYDVQASEKVIVIYPTKAKNVE